MIGNKRLEAIRASITSITRILAKNKNIKVTQAGIKAFVLSDHEGKPVSVNIPYIPDNASDEFITAINGFLDHEVAHILFSDFSVAYKFINEVTKKKPKEAKSIEAIQNMIEDARIEKLMGESFRGSGHHLESVGEYVTKKAIQPSLDGAKTEQGRAHVLFMPAIRALHGQQFFKNYMSDKWEMMGFLGEVIQWFEDDIQGVQSTRDSCNLSLKIFNRIKDEIKKKEDEEKPKPPKPPKQPPQPKPENEKPSEDKGEESGESDSSEDGEQGDDDSDGEDSNNSESESEKSGEPKQDPEGGEEESEESESESESGGSGEGESQDDEQDEDGGFAEMGDDEEPDGERQTEEGETETFKVEEIKGGSISDMAMSIINIEAKDLDLKNESYTAFTNEFDVVEKIDRKNCKFNENLMKSMEEKTRAVVGPMQKTIERMVLSKEKSRNIPGKTSGKLNQSALFKLKTGDLKVFRKKEEEDTVSAAVSLVVDCSGSMYGEKIITAICAAYAMSSVLTKVGVKNEIIGFTTKGIPKKMRKMIEEHEGIGEASRVEALHMPIFKAFDEPLSSEQKIRLSCMMGGSGFEGVTLCNNVDGESIMIAAKRLASVGTMKKKMIVLSDGAPASSGCSGRSSLEDHLKETIAHIEKAGIDVLGIGIKDSNVKRFYKRYIVINKVEDLPVEIMKEIKGMFDNK